MRFVNRLKVNKKQKTMKTFKSILILGLLLAAISKIFAAAPVEDTIKILAGDREILIITNTKEDQEQNLRSGIDEFNALIEQKQAEIDSIDRVIDSLKNILDTLTDKDLSAQIEQLKKQIQEDKKFIEALKMGIEDIEAQLDELEQQAEVETKPEEPQDTEIITKTKKKKFVGHWGGIELGLNSFLTPDNQLINSTDNILAPSLYTSFEVNLNCFKSKLPVTSFFGLVTGFGFKFNNYKYKDFPYYDSQTYILALDSLHSEYDQNGEIDKIVLKTTTLRVPILAEIQFDRNGKYYISAGGYIGLVTNNKLKFVYIVNGKKVVTKHSINPMINPVAYGLTARIGFDKIQFYADLSLSQLFKSPDNPVIYPASLGLRLKI